MADTDLAGILRGAMEEERDGFTFCTQAAERSEDPGARETFARLLFARTKPSKRSTGRKIASRCCCSARNGQADALCACVSFCAMSLGVTQVSQVAGGGVGTRGWVTSGKLSWSPSLVIKYGESQISFSSASTALYPPQ